MSHIPAHYLKYNVAREMPHEHVFFDVETTQTPLDDSKNLHRLRLGWACYWRRRNDGHADTLQYTPFHTSGEFWDFVASHLTGKQKLLLIAHNVAYDFSILDGFKQLERMGFELKSVYSAGVTNILRFRRAGQTIMLLDNMNYFRCSLAELGHSIGMEKLEVDWRTEDETLLSTYCHRDVEILHKAWVTLYNFIEEHNLGCFAATLPAQAMKAYRHRFMAHKILINHDPDAVDIERQAYHGGRCSIFYQGVLNDGPYYKLDVNSMYPYVMQDNYYPTILKGIYHNPPLSTLKEWCDNYSLIAQVRVTVPEPVYVKTYKGHSIYPIGSFETTLTTPEIKYGLERDYIRDVDTVAVYTQGKIFEQYVRYFYPLKARYSLENNSPFRTMVKYYLNTLYGKFGQKAHKWTRLDGYSQEYTENEAILDVRTGKWRHIYHFGSQAWETTEEGESRDSFPGIAAHVTAFARMYLWKLIKIAGFTHCYYCDTDSLIVDQEGYNNLSTMLSESELGKLKVEATSQSVRLITPKNYLMGDAWTRKGVPQHAEQVDENTWTYDQFPSLKGQAKNPNPVGLVTVRVEKTLSNRIYDGIVQPDGHIIPLQAEDLEKDEVIDPVVQEQIDNCIAQIDALQSNRIVDSKIVFRMWDYSRGDWKRARDKSGQLVPLEYSNTDSIATEFGFNDLNALQTAIRKQLLQDQRVRELKRKLYLLRNGPETKSATESAIPF
jgi:hypothetical protein